MALETSDSAEPRLAKITRLIAQSKYGVHDISRLQARAAGEYYRLNMPFELGVDFGHRQFHPKATRKRILVLEKERYQYQRAFSDLSGCDIKHHNNQPTQLISAVRDWFKETVKLTVVPGPTLIWNRFNDFMYELHVKCLDRGFSEDDFTTLSFHEFIQHAITWVKANR